jgi:transposase
LLKRQNLKQSEAQIKATDCEHAALVTKQKGFKVASPSCSADPVSTLIDMPELSSLEARQAAALSEVAPVARQSGSWQGKSVIQGTGTTAPSALYASAGRHPLVSRQARNSAIVASGRLATPASIAACRPPNLGDRPAWERPHGNVE